MLADHNNELGQQQTVQCVFSVWYSMRDGYPTEITFNMDLYRTETNLSWHNARRACYSAIKQANCVQRLIRCTRHRSLAHTRLTMTSTTTTTGQEHGSSSLLSGRADSDVSSRWSGVGGAISRVRQLKGKLRMTTRQRQKHRQRWSTRWQRPTTMWLSQSTSVCRTAKEVARVSNRQIGRCVKRTARIYGSTVVFLACARRHATGFRHTAQKNYAKPIGC